MDEQVRNVCFQQVVALAAAGARGLEPQLPEKQIIDWPCAAQLAMQQGVLPIVGCAVMRNSNPDVPSELGEQIIEHTRMAAAKNHIRQQRIMWMINQLEHAGIDAKLIKGYAVADCYDKPECRTSTDTDILINRKQERDAYEVLRNLDFRVDRRNATSHHAVCQHPKHGMVELHVQLYDELIHEGWFGALSEDDLIKEKEIRIETANGEYTTLGYTDHALFLVIHMVKHFIGIGINIRMMLDVALFISKHKADIDFDRFWRVLIKLHFDCVVNCVLTIMVRTGCFDWSEFPGASERVEEQVNAFITDVIAASFASKVSQEDNVYYEYNKAVMQKSVGRTKYCAYMFGWVLRNLKSQMWPGRELLYALYDVDKEKRYMLPILRIRQVFILPIQKLQTGITPIRLLTNQYTDECIARRFRVFKLLNML